MNVSHNCRVRFLPNDLEAEYGEIMHPNSIELNKVNTKNVICGNKNKQCSHYKLNWPIMAKVIL